MTKISNNALEKLRDSESSSSLILGAIVLVVVGLLLVNYWRGNRAAVSDVGMMTEQMVPTPNENGYVPPSVLPTEYIVVKGDHLWGIAETYYGSGYNWVDLAKENNLSEPFDLGIGQSLRVPSVSAKKSTVATVVAVQQGGVISGDSYTVLENDSLWNIAVRAYGDGYKWTSIYQANADIIEDPNMLNIGENLKLPR